MNIMFVIDTMGKGGAERVVSNLATYLCKKDKVSIITIRDTKIEYVLNENIEIHTTENKKQQNSKSKNILQKINKYKNIIKKLNEYKKNIKPDIIISFLPEACFVTLISNLFLNTLTIISIRNDPKIEYKSVKNKILMKLLYPRADGVVFQTKEAQKYFSKKIQRKSEIIPNPINQEFIGEPYVGERNNDIISVGRLENQKNHKMLIKAFKKISKKYPNYTLTIYGEGKLRKELENLVLELELYQKVNILGNVQNIKEKIYKSAMFILTSDYEGMPNALMEAMALGMPVISTDCPCGGPAFLIKNNENGMLIEPNNEKDLENAMEKLIENEEFAKRIGKNANSICQSLNPIKINKKWKQYIEELYQERYNKVEGE